VTRFDVVVEVWLRPGIADPQGATIQRALPAVGVSGVSELTTGKAFRFSVDGASADEAERRAGELAHRLLANPVIEDAVVRVLGARQ